MISENIAEYIRERGIKQTAIANAIGISASNLNNKINGRNSLNAEEFLAICEFLDVPCERFRDGKKTQE